jgi:hypothetical protein
MFRLFRILENTQVMPVLVVPGTTEGVPLEHYRVFSNSTGISTGLHNSQANPRLHTDKLVNPGYRISKQIRTNFPCDILLSPAKRRTLGGKKSLPWMESVKLLLSQPHAASINKMMNIYQQEQSHLDTMATKKSSFSKFFPGRLRTMLDAVQGTVLATGISW